jgi:hypothetical protein
MHRKRLVIAVVAAVLILAALPTITAALDALGIIPFARAIRAEYLTGTALAVIGALLILLPRTKPEPAVGGHACTVCDAPLRPGSRYCPACGSRVAAGPIPD